MLLRGRAVAWAFSPVWCGCLPRTRWLSGVTVWVYIATMKQQVRIASPCHADWNAMSGDARVRHCAECNLDVYNFSEMSEREIDRLVEEREERLCARFYQRPDGTMLTKNCPTGFRASLLRATKLTSAALATIIGLIPGFARASTPAANPLRASRGAGFTLLQIQAAPKGVTIQVVDVSGAVVPHATVHITSETSDAAWRDVTNVDGKYTLNEIPTGKYRIRVEVNGFKPWVQEHVSLPATVAVSVEVQVASTMGVIVTVAERPETAEGPLATKLEEPKKHKRAKKIPATKPPAGTASQPS